MKLIQSTLFSLAVFACGYASAQCTFGCPSGATALPTTSATLAAGSNYCISTTNNLSSNTYTIDGTLVVSAGTVTIGSVTLKRTGVIQVKFGARLIITGTLTGDNSTPTSAIDNIVVCNGGYLDITGSFSQGEINLAVNDFGIMKVTGAWSANSTTTRVKIGTGSLIELCSSFNINRNGFFQETGTGVSYLVVHGGMSQFAVNGFLSSLGNASQLKWTAEGAASWVSHPAAFTCSPCNNYNLAPPGTNSTCGSAANTLYNTTLLATQPTITRPEVINDKTAIYPNPANGFFYLQLPKKHTYTSLSIFNQTGQQVYGTKVKAGTAVERYNLPVQLPPGLYFVKLTGKESSMILRIVKD
jgi:hypothetical protein